MTGWCDSGGFFFSEGEKDRDAWLIRPTARVFPGEAFELLGVDFPVVGVGELGEDFFIFLPGESIDDEVNDEMRVGGLGHDPGHDPVGQIPMAGLVGVTGKEEDVGGGFAEAGTAVVDGSLVRLTLLLQMFLKWLPPLFWHPPFPRFRSEYHLWRPFLCREGHGRGDHVSLFPGGGSASGFGG